MNHTRGPSTAPIARKRKERESLLGHTINGSGNARVKTAHPYPSHPNTTTTTSFKQKKPSEPISSNRLLAGYLAHEFLTQGSLLGHAFDPARAEAVPTEPMKPDPVSVGPSAAGGAEATPKKSYGEVARILKGDGAHIPGIVNPTQLARWIQM